METSLSRRSFVKNFLAVLAGVEVLSWAGRPCFAAAQEDVAQEESSALTVTVNDHVFMATFADTAAAREFRSLLPLTLDAKELNGNEKYAELDAALPTDGAQSMDEIEAGDIFLYGNNDVVLFYESHPNGGWSYVPLAHIEDTTGLADAVGAGDVTITYEEVPAQSDQASSQEDAKEATTQTTTYSTQEIWVDNGDKRIYGVAYVPDGANESNKVPLVILSHGFGSTHVSTAPYAQALAEHGYAAYIFDFCGGATWGSRSDGDPTQMSVMTEADDLDAVIAAARDWDFVDAQRIVIGGESQGGMVSAVVAARNPEAAQALVLLYPAFCIVDDAHAQFASKDDVPDTYRVLGWMTVGRNYATDVWDYDVYGEIGKYTGPVLIVHGDRDGIVDVSYAQRAAQTYPNAQLEILAGAGHGFSGEDFNAAVSDILAFLGENLGQ